MNALLFSVRLDQWQKVQPPRVYLIFTSLWFSLPSTTVTGQFTRIANDQQALHDVVESRLQLAFREYPARLQCIGPKIPRKGDRSVAAPDTTFNA